MRKKVGPWRGGRGQTFCVRPRLPHCKVVLVSDLEFVFGVLLKNMVHEVGTVNGVEDRLTFIPSSRNHISTFRCID